MLCLTKIKKWAKSQPLLKLQIKSTKLSSERGFIPEKQIRSITLDNVLVDTGATRLCLPKNIILDLGLPLQGEVDVKIATGVHKARIFKMLNLSVEGREGVFNCIELPEDCDALLPV